MELSSLLQKEEVQTSRQYELDLLKALAIVSMIICHAVIQLAAHIPGYEQDMAYVFADLYLGCYLAVAHAFMLAMGFGIIFSKKNAPSDLIRRGIHLYILAFVLNFFRYGMYAVAYGLIEGEFMEETVYSLIVLDILQFAGLALIATGLFKLLKLNVFHMLVIGVILSIAGGILAFTYNGSYVANYFIGHFVTTTKECSCFVFFNWYIFVAAGMMLGTVIRRTEDTDRLYRRLLYIAIPVLIIYIALTCIFGPMFMTKSRWYYATSLPESIGLMSIDLSLMGIFHFLLKKVDISRVSVLITMSQNVNQIYCIQWCVIGFVDSIFCYMIGIVFPYWFMYLFGVALIFFSYWTAKLWTNRKRKA